MITIQNKYITVEIDPQGAQLKSIFAKGREYLWQGSPDSWNKRAPILFPTIGRMRQGQYQVNGVTYDIPSHGFAPDSEFPVSHHCDTAVTFTLESSEATREMYPFDFKFSVIFSLEGFTLHKSHLVENTGTGDMYYEVGGHDGFNVPFLDGEKMDDCAIRIPGIESFSPYEFDEFVTLQPKSRQIPAPDGCIALKPATYGIDCVILENLPQRRAELLDSKGNVQLALDFPDMDYVTLWTKTVDFDTDYVCIEPWSSLPDAHFVSRELKDKTGIRRLAPGQQEKLGYDITLY